MEVTVKDLKEMIVNLPDDSKVIFKMISGCCGDYEDLEISTSYDSKITSNNLNYLVIEFLPLPGYRTCRQASGTIRKDKEYLEEI